MSHGRFHVFIPEEPLPYAPEVRLAHDYPLGRGARTLRKERIGDHALHYFVTGSGEYFLNGRRYPVEPGRVFLVRPGQGYDFRLNDEATVRMFNIHFDLEDKSEYASPFPCPDDAAPGKLVLSPEWADSLKLMQPQRYEELFQGLLMNGSAKLYRRGRMLEILALLLEESRGISPGSGSAEKIVLRAQEILRGELDRPWTLTTLAKKLGVSRSHLAAVFRERTGLSVGEFRRQAQVERARYLLSTSDTPIKAVAAECGFADVHHFGRIFKSLSDIAPGEFRDKYLFLDD